jgi:isopentenyl phosphate kinase
MTFFIKLGGSIITDKSKPFTSRNEVIQRLIQEIVAARNKNPHLRCIIGHGSGSFAHSVASKHTYPYGPKAIEEIHGAALALHYVIMEECRNAGLNIRSISLQNILSNAFDMEEKFTPIVYGDITPEGDIYSTEMIFEKMIRNKILPKKIIMVTDTNGIMGTGSSYKKITRENIREVKRCLKKTEFDITGGMAHKLDCALSWADRDIETTILNGNTPGNLERVLRGKTVEGTIVSANKKTNKKDRTFYKAYQ